MSIFDMFRKEESTSQLQITVNALNFDTFLDFLGTLGFAIVDFTGYHITYEDYSEEMGWQLAYGGQDVALVEIRYIDNHFWPKSENGKNIPRDEDPKWRIIVTPISISIHPKANLPSKISYALRNYTDGLSKDQDTKKAYEQYKEEDKLMAEVVLLSHSKVPQSLSQEHLRVLKNKNKINSVGFRPLPEKLEEVEKQIKHCDKALEIRLNYSLTWIQKIECLIELNKIEQAISCCEEALRIELSHALTDVLWNAKGICYSRLSKYEKAILCYDNSLRLKPNFAITWKNKGRALSSLEKYQEAINCFEESLKLFPNDTVGEDPWVADYIESRKGKGFALKRLERYREAIYCYDKILEIDPADSDTYIERGFARMMMDQYELAIVDCNKAVEIAPQNAEGYFMRALVKGKNQVELAILDYNKAIELNPLHFNAYFVKALTCEKTGRLEEARETLKKLIKNTPSQYSDVMQRAREELEKLQGK